MTLSSIPINSNTPQQHFNFIDYQPPIDIQRLICSFLNDPKDVVHFGLISKRLSALLSDTLLWNSLLHKHFPDSYAKLKSREEGLSLYKRLSHIENNIRDGKYRLQTFEEHQDWIRCMATWNGKLISGSDDRSIKIWDLNTGQELRTLNGHQDWINCITIWNDKLISGSDDAIIKIWDLNTGQELQTLNEQSKIHCITIWNDKLISGSEDHTIKFWDLNTGQILQTLIGHKKMISNLIVLDPGKFVSYSLDTTIKIWNFN
jgi:WD40 repeat protein